jgi:hypothetical protein
MPKSDDQYSDSETAGRREAALKKMLATPPSPHVKSKKDLSLKDRKAKKSKPNA